MIIAMDHHPAAAIELGDTICVVHVAAANVVKDIRENIRNLIGGRMVHYEALIQGAVNIALKELDEKAKAQGYDGVIGVKISHPVVVEGAVEVVVYGNMFRYTGSQAAAEVTPAAASTNGNTAGGDGAAVIDGREKVVGR
jgi:uncharacterized protein YbjQ (UPF0145 family)